MLLAHPDACTCLQSVGVDVVGLVDVADFILKSEDISFINFVDLVLSLRGSNVARVKDIVDLRTYLTMELEHKAQIRDEANNERLARIEDSIVRASSYQPQHEGSSCLMGRVNSEAPDLPHLR
mmetsp:Transcript_132028/g.228752  ORF Transcript_132028/g.228752 Transcript_132028/m.228752 type:complete len:123 (+) Transcript_132028:2-370(+)